MDHNKEAWLASQETQELRQEIKRRRDGYGRAALADCAPGAQHEYGIANFGRMDALEELEKAIWGYVE